MRNKTSPTTETPAMSSASSSPHIVTSVKCGHFATARDRVGQCQWPSDGVSVEGRETNKCVVWSAVAEAMSCSHAIDPFIDS